MSKLYKYLNPAVASCLKLDDSNFGVKLSFLEEYNDPFESFLAIDFNRDPRILAYYSDILRMNQSSLVSCFSKRPDNPPMWAHYASNMTGFILELDEEKLKAYLDAKYPESYHIADIKYMETVNPDVEQSLKRALVTLKPRHLHWLNQSVQYALYFYKQSYWEYENERRIIINPRCAINIGDIYLLSIAFKCVSSIIVGRNIDSGVKSALYQLSVDFELDYYEMKIGKTLAKPYFMNNAKESFIFDGRELSRRDSCLNCGEPTDNSSHTCFWCAISDNDRDQAANANAFRLLAEMGRLDSVLEGYKQIDRKYGSE